MPLGQKVRTAPFIFFELLCASASVHARAHKGRQREEERAAQVAWKTGKKKEKKKERRRRTSEGGGQRWRR